MFKKVIDQLMWRQVAPAPNAHANATCMAADLRSDVSRNPFAYQLASATVLNRFNIITKAWQLVISPALAGSFGAGTAMAFAPSLSLVGTIAAGATTTSVTLSTALPTAVGVNMLANRGGSGDFGFRIRITDTTAGKTEERWIVGNTGGTAPVITVNAAFTFTPATGARYEILSGRVFMLNGGTTAANIWRSFEVASNTLSTGLTTTNLPATIGTDSDIMVLDELYTPFDMKPGEGMVKGSFTYDTGLSSLTATAAGASTLTGQASGGDAVVAANEYRNFQIRIVQDTTTPGAVGQRRIIASHTAGASPVYTLGSAWTTQPSASAKYVIELPNLILLRSTATTTVYTYNYGDATVNNGTNSITAGAWSTTYFGAAPAANASGGVWMPSFGIQPDTARNARHSFCYFFRGGAATLDVLDIAGSITGTWTGAITYDGSTTLTVGTTGHYSPFGNEGRMFYMNIYTASAVSQIFRFDVQNRVLSPYAPTDFLQSGGATIGKRMASYAAIDGTDTYGVVLMQSHLSTVAQELVVLV
ncbi:MAG: hypothetical protein IM650_12170 [Phenylobacterium sp.]|uniref:hypothetical protein n=2 Tax=Bacteria TaxID=2 RepID=UPI0025FECC47|nr:hypothetical protein [Phenylobacterium sp.]MCA6258836.1 hypothetical protein [Phenylobacterium sp.]MCA6263960.1 hypothetical protein [Phenylobacterium sp.]MCA6269949.1 hypothetical protein [Phenylobacterium sp.]MCA6300350.1 hypothetical protein [Phenylobacterium sp.]MCA6307283.1 hypothetical protein [Phenylobacterium sp.]